MLAALALMATPASASLDRLGGEWCDEAGDERMVVDKNGIGFNEHTVCELQESRPEGEALKLKARCANVYPNGDEVVRMDERVVQVEAGPDRSFVEVRVEGAEPVIFRRCPE
jgi:hypothetical protein